MPKSLRPSLGLVPALLTAALLARCGCEAPAPDVVLHAPSDLAEATRMAVDDLQRDLEAIGGFGVTRGGLPAPDCEDGVVRIVVLGHEHAPDGSRISENPIQPQYFDVEDFQCGASGRVTTLRAGSLLSAQWAVYAMAEHAGILYLHPEQTLYPARPRWRPGDVSGLFGPSFQRRAMRVHRTHPVELSAPLDDSNVDMAAHQKRWIDWNVKLRQTLVNGWDGKYVGDYAYRRGFTREKGFSLVNTQQGGRPVIDPDDPRSDEEQIADEIERQMAPVEGVPDATIFNFQFNPSEFTEVDDQVTVNRIRFIAEYFRENYPGVQLYTINHGTHGEPTPHYGVRFFDLSKFAPENLGVRLHPLMFYDLERPAPVYGNENFNYLLEFAREEETKRRIIHYPESSWWLTFDLPVPLYLAPVTIEARAHDIALLADRLALSEDAPTGVYGHDLFTSGQEWGYWLIDWCTARMTWDAKLTHEHCVSDFSDGLESGHVVRNVLAEVTKRQVSDLRDPDLIRMLVGSDDATEAAFDAGIVFHPLPPAPKEVLGWDDDAVARFRERSLEPLEAMAADYHAWADRVEGILGAQSESQAPFVREIRDGLRAFALRADLARAVYGTVLELRDAVAANDLNAVEAAHAGVDAARAIVERAREVVRAREADYRYPDELTIAGDEVDTPGAVENDTIYPYRYLSRTHRLFYWERPVQQLGELFGEGLERVSVNGRILRHGTPLVISVLLDAVDELSIDYGDGTQADTLSPHTYGAQGLYEWHLNARGGTDLVVHDDAAAVVERRFVFPRGRLKVEAPKAAALIAGLLPGMEVGLGEDGGGQFLVLGNIDDGGHVATRGTLLRRSRAGNASGPADLTMELRNVGRVTVRSAVLEVQDAAGPEERRLEIRGEMLTGEIIDLLVQVGGFDPPGARQLVADILGSTPETLPEAVDFVIGAKGFEEVD